MVDTASSSIQYLCASKGSRLCHRSKNWSHPWAPGTAIESVVSLFCPEGRQIDGDASLDPPKNMQTKDRPRQFAKIWCFRFGKSCTTKTHNSSGKIVIPTWSIGVRRYVTGTEQTCHVNDMKSPMRPADASTSREKQKLKKSFRHRDFHGQSSRNTRTHGFRPTVITHHFFSRLQGRGTPARISSRTS